MKKILLILTFILFSTLVYAGNNDNITESGFINKKVKKMYIYLNAKIHKN